MLRKFPLYFCIGAALCLSGCPLVDLTPAERAAKELKEGMESISKGMGELDPAGLKKLLGETDSLRKQLAETNTKLTGLGLGAGVFVLSERRLYLEVVDYAGAHRVNAWIDDPKEWTSKDVSLPNQTRKLQDYGLSNAELGVTVDVSSDLSSNMMPQEMKICRDSAEKAFQKYLTGSPGSSPVTQASATSKVAHRIALNEQFLTPGTHTISVQITPLEATGQEKWYLTGRIVSEIGEKIDIVKEFQWSADQYPQHLNKPLPQIDALVTVYASPAK
jgi:hypothetical protein